MCPLAPFCLMKGGIRGGYLLLPIVLDITLVDSNQNSIISLA